MSVGPPQSLDHRGRDLAAEPLKVVSPGEFRMSLNENLADISPILSCINPSSPSSYLHKMSEIYLAKNKPSITLGVVPLTYW